MKRRKCDKKKFSEHQALYVIARAKEQANEGFDERKEKRSYYCRECKSWHVTSKGYNDLAFKR